MLGWNRPPLSSGHILCFVALSSSPQQGSGLAWNPLVAPRLIKAWSSREGAHLIVLSRKQLCVPQTWPGWQLPALSQAPNGPRCGVPCCCWVPRASPTQPSPAQSRAVEGSRSLWGLLQHHVHLLQRKHLSAPLSPLAALRSRAQENGLLSHLCCAPSSPLLPSAPGASPSCLHSLLWAHTLFTELCYGPREVPPSK